MSMDRNVGSKMPKAKMTKTRGDTPSFHRKRQMPPPNKTTEKSLLKNYGKNLIHSVELTMILIMVYETKCQKGNIVYLTNS